MGRTPNGESVTVVTPGRASDAPGSSPSARLRSVLPAGVGLACLLATMPIDSAAMNTFQRFAGLAAWIDAFAPAMHVCALLAAIVALLPHAVRGARRVPDGALAAAGATLFVTDGLAISWSAMSGDALGGFMGGVWPLAALTGVSCLCVALAWGRVFARLGRQASMRAVVCAGVTRAVVGVALIELPDAASVLCYLSAMAVSVGLLIWCTARPTPDGAGDAGDAAAGALATAVGAHAPGDGADDPLDGTRDLGERVRSFVAVSWRALLGLLALALVTGMMRATAMGHHLVQMATLALGAVVLGLLASHLAHRQVVSVSNDIVIPLLAALMLATSNVTYALGAGAVPAVALTYALYGYAALLTLAVLGAMASAREFASDAIFSLAVGLFCLASLGGLRLGSVVGMGVVPAVTTVVTTLYAIAMVVPALARAHAGDRDRTRGVASDVDEIVAPAGVVPPSAPAGRADGNGAATASRPTPQDREAFLDGRCRELAAERGLTARETEVLGYLARGHGSAYISETLFISTNTVRTHTHNLYHKLGVSSREQIIALVCRGDGAAASR